MNITISQLEKEREIVLTELETARRDLNDKRARVSELTIEVNSLTMQKECIEQLLSLQAEKRALEHTIKPDSALYAIVHCPGEEDEWHELIRMLLSKQTIFEYVSQWSGWTNEDAVKDLCFLWQHLVGKKLFFSEEEARQNRESHGDDDYLVVFGPSEFHQRVFEMVTEAMAIDRT